VNVFGHDDVAKNHQAIVAAGVVKGLEENVAADGVLK
jgi:hypothetical protein